MLDNLLRNPYDRCEKGVAAIYPQTQAVWASMDFHASERYAAPDGASG